MSEPSADTSGQNDVFLKAFVPGLVLGLVIGALAGALIPPFLAASDDRPGPVAGTGVSNDQRTQMRDDEASLSDREIEDGAATDPEMNETDGADQPDANPASGG